MMKEISVDKIDEEIHNLRWMQTVMTSLHDYEEAEREIEKLENLKRSI